jgi:beta-lactamase class A
MRSLESRLARLIAASGAACVAVVSTDLRGRDAVAINADVAFHPASTMKVCVLMEVFRQAHAGRLALDERLPIGNEFRSIADGTAYALSPADDSETDLYSRVGSTATIRELAELMIVVSSNLATNLLVDRVGAANVTAFMRELGAPSLVVLRGVEDDPAFEAGLDNVATARGLARVLGLLARGEVVSASASGAMVEILLAQAFNEGIPAGLPPGTPVAHKTGSIDGAYHDAAIVDPAGPHPYVLVVLTRGIADEGRAHALVASISREIHEARVARPGLQADRP